MTRDNTDRLAMFAGETVEVRRLALNWEQVEEHGPPPNPAKETDSRAPGYIDAFGDSSWELDALDPTTIDGIIENEVRDFIDLDEWHAAEEAENAAKTTLTDAADRWTEVEEFLRGEA